jgi:hypothetical protein
MSHQVVFKPKESNLSSEFQRRRWLLMGTDLVPRIILSEWTTLSNNISQSMSLSQISIVEMSSKTLRETKRERRRDTSSSLAKEDESEK